MIETAFVMVGGTIFLLCAMSVLWKKKAKKIDMVNSVKDLPTDMFKKDSDYAKVINDVSNIEETEDETIANCEDNYQLTLALLSNTSLIVEYKYLTNESIFNNEQCISDIINELEYRGLEYDL
jgi:hypothetical protein